MEIRRTRHRLGVRDATVASAYFDGGNLSSTHSRAPKLSAAFERMPCGNARVVDANISGALFSGVNTSDVKIEKAICTGMMIDGVKVGDLLPTYQAAKGAGGE